MKKKLIFSVALTLTMCAGIFFSNSVIRNNRYSNLQIENIEALAYEELPEFTITCSNGSEGRCFITTFVQKICGPYFYYQCMFNGNQNFSCTTPCNLI